MSESVDFDTVLKVETQWACSMTGHDAVDILPSQISPASLARILCSPIDNK